MRNIFKFLIIGVLAIFASCDNLNEVPEFSDSDAFVAFDNGTASINENGDILRIPVTLASISGMTQTITYTIIDGTAKEGVNFTIADAAQTLSFDAENRTRNIVVNIINNPGEFTGDLSFKIQLSENGAIKPSAQNICTVVIKDLDHPLAAILGTYRADGVTYFNGAKMWDMVLSKDAEDVTVVWISNLEGTGSGSGFYGIVNEEMTEIAVPLGQINTVHTTSNGDGNVYLYGMDADEELYDAGNLIIQIQEGGQKLYFGVYGPSVNLGGTNYYWDLVYPDYYATKL